MNQAKLLKQHIGYWLNRLRNVVNYTFEERLLQYNVSVAEWCIMVSVYDNSANSINGLAEYIEIDKASISRTVSKLVDKGLLLHITGKDKRSGFIDITEKGLELLPKLIKEAEGNESYFFLETLSKSDIQKMRALIHAIFSKLPGSSLDGWLDNNNYKEEFMNTIKDILQTATKNQWPYPKTFEALKNAGLENYEVKFSGKYHAHFSGTFGSYTEDNLEGYKPMIAANDFNAQGIKEAIINHVVKQTHYLDFLQDAIKNGITHYRVDIKKRTVTYFNESENEQYTEHVPEYKSS